MGKQSEQRQEQMRIEDALDNLLYKAMEEMQRPTKVGLDFAGNFVELYPVPVFKGNHVIRTEYKPAKAKHVILPDELFIRYCILMDELEPPMLNDRKKKHTEADVIEWVQLREQGMTYLEIASATGAKKGTVSNYIRKHQKKKEAVAV